MPDGHSAPIDVDAIRLSSAAFWMGGGDERDVAFRALRDAPGLRFFAERSQAADSVVPTGPGYWALVRHADVVAVSRDPKLFCSGLGSGIEDIPPELGQYLGSVINMDDPQHHRLRALVAKGFTPKEIARVEASVAAKAADVVRRMIEANPSGRCDFVEWISAPLPLEVICDMMGIPAEDHAEVHALTDVIFGGAASDPTFTWERWFAAINSLVEYAVRLGERRRGEPGDDLTSALMVAEVDGEHLTLAEFGSFFTALVVAGNETTRNAISHGMRALTDHPDQRDLWFADFETHRRGAVEEIVRWATPINLMRRTATADAVIAGQHIAAGDKVVMFYVSANRDERVFADPYRFDITRSPNPQVGFGAGGPHFCLGANLARREITVMFDELRKQLPDLRISGEPTRTNGVVVNGISQLSCTWA